jgi:hypothetical protein
MRGHRSESSLFFATGMVAFALTVFLPRSVRASLVELTARPDTGDTVFWGTPLQNQFSSPLNFTSTGGTSGTANFSGLGGLFEQCCVGANGNYNGDFAPGDTVLAIGTNGLSINFNTPVQIVGTQIQDNRIGDYFTAEILAFNGNVLLGTFTENGFTGDVGDNSAIFLGVEDATADISSVTYLTFTSNPFTLQDVNINQVTTESSATPIPAALPLFATGLGAIGLLGWRRRKA